MNLGTKCRIIAEYGKRFHRDYLNLLDDLEQAASDREWNYYVDILLNDFNFPEPDMDDLDKRRILIDLLVEEGFNITTTNCCEFVFIVVLRSK